MLFLLFLLQVGAENPNTPCVPLKGGPFDGMCPGRVTSKQGPYEVVKVLPAHGTGAAIPPQLLSTLSKLLSSQRNGKPINREILASGATEGVCATFSSDCPTPKPLQSWSLSTEFVPNTPYLLADGRVRIEWTQKGELEFLSLITFDGAKVKDVATIRPYSARVVSWLPYRGGSLDGLGVGQVARPDNGASVISLTPSTPNASPIPTRDMPAVQAFMDAFQKRDPSKLHGFVTDDVKLQSCTQGYNDPCEGPVDFEQVQVGTECAFNTPYYLGNQVVRLEWLLKGVMWYWSELYMTEGKIRFVRVHRPDVPQEIQPTH